ncbi:MAG: hypothetical protein LAN70_15680 [Acidobacteriia bacterium]|nr:hypothetical protein [Terriglobia bacterium]
MDVQIDNLKIEVNEEPTDDAPVTLAYIGDRLFRKSTRSLQWHELIAAPPELNAKLNRAEEAFEKCLS